MWSVQLRCFFAAVVVSFVASSTGSETAFALPLRSQHAPTLSAGQQENLVRAQALVDRIVTCNYVESSGVFTGEGLWQSGNTLESICNTLMLSAASNMSTQANLTGWTSLIANTFANTPVIVDQCFDDHQVRYALFDRCWFLT
jgi:phosphatidate phosphatase APP1